MKVLWVVMMGAAMTVALVSSTSAVTNEWVKPSSGNWEELFWSLGVLPSADQEAVTVSNPGWKAVAIGANTAANFPASLLLNNLIIDAPTNSANRLLLNWAGHNVPLVVRSNLVIGTNGSVAGHFSALQAGNVELRGYAAFSDSARATLDRVTLWPRSALNLNDATVASSNLSFIGGSMTQSVGVAVLSEIRTVEQGYVLGSARFDNAYVLSGGVLYSGLAEIGHYGLTGHDVFRFVHSGGVHSNTTMTLWGGRRHRTPIHHAGFYTLTDGLLVSGQMTIFAGIMEQNGGTNLTRELVVSEGGYHTLNAGQLVTSNTSVGSVDCLGRGFVQNGGSHTVQNRLTIGNGADYALSAGTLSAPIIELSDGLQGDGGLWLNGGEIFNSGILVLRRSSLGVSGPPRQLGKLQVLEGTGYGCPYSEWDQPTRLYLGTTSTPVVVQFQDSRDLAWSGTLRIAGWSNDKSGNGPDRLFVGTSDQGLTAAQLARIVFQNPGGFAAGVYPARILANGELVPNASRPSLGYAARSRPLVLSWDGNYSLWTTTNLLETWTMIPNATSPYTNSFTDPQRFFKLSSPAP